jgi:LPS-assembly protein
MFHSLKFTFIAVFAAVMTALFASPAGAAPSAMHLRSSTGSDVTISAAKGNFINIDGHQTIELTGEVKVIYDQQFISCDHALIDRKAETITADGNLVISSPQAYLEGDSATMSYRDNTGTILNGFVKSGPVIFEGRVVKKTGPMSYDAEKASFTACTTCPTAWTFSGSRIQAELGGYAYIKHAQLRVANVPTLWLPYLIVPLKSQRQTGFLIPTVDYSSEGGTALGWSFFWAMSRSQDAEIMAKYYTLRGLKGKLNYRYLLTPTSGGELTTGYLHDNVFKGLSIFGPGADAGSKANRTFLNYSHNYDLPDGFNTKLKLNYVSDVRYPQDFPEDIAGRGDPALENRFTLTRNTERSHSSLDAAYYINQLHTNPIDTNRESVHRFPEVRYDLIDRPVTSTGLLSSVLFKFHFDYANFTRDDLAWDDAYFDPTGTTRAIDRARCAPNCPPGGPTGGQGQVFDPNSDIVRTGQRIDFQPQLSAPFRLGSSIDVLPTLGFRHTQYSLNVTPPPNSTFDPAPYRQYVRGSLSFRTRFTKIFGDNTSPLEAPRPSVTDWSDTESRIAGATLAGPLVPPKHPDVYRHEIEPEIVLEGMQTTHESQDNAFLGYAAQTPAFLDQQPISDSDFTSRRGIQFDYEDRIVNRNTVSTFLSNRIVRKSWLADGSPIYRQVFSLRLGQSYDFDENKVDQNLANPNGRQRFNFSDFSALLDVRLDHFETNTLIRYFPYHGKTNTSSRARVMDDLGRYFEVNFVENYLITVDRDDALTHHTQTIGFLSGFTAKYLGIAATVDLTPNNWENIQFAVKSWGGLITLKPPGNCWGVALTLRQDIGQSLYQHLSFDYNFGGEGPKVAAAQ